MNRGYSFTIALWVLCLVLFLKPTPTTAEVDIYFVLAELEKLNLISFVQERNDSFPVKNDDPHFNSKMGPLALNPNNPRYFLNTATGDTVYLTGSHVWSNLLDRGDTTPPPAWPFESYLNMMESYGHNFIRLWTWELTSSSGTETSGSYWQPHPWERTGPGTALDGLPKFDLGQHNQTYFDRLRERCLAARERGIYVSIMLFEGHRLQFDDNNWAHHPFNDSNNINRLSGNPRAENIHDNTVASVIALQKAYIHKVVDAVNDLDNIMYEICNEDGGGTMAWQEAMKSSLESYQATKANQHVIGITPRWDRKTSRGDLEAECFNSSGDWVSPLREIYRSAPPANNTRVIISDTDHLWGIGGNRDWVWKSFCRGLNPIFMDPYDDWTIGMTKATAISIREAMGDTKSFADMVNMPRMAPKPSLASSGYCLGHVLDPGPDEYIAYIPSGTSITMDLSNSSGDLSVDWFNTVTGETKPGGTVSGGSSVQNFTAPFSYAVLFLKEMTNNSKN